MHGMESYEELGSSRDAMLGDVAEISKETDS